MSERPSIAEELVSVVDAMPGQFATIAQHAAYQRRMAAVMRRIAAETDNPLITRDATATAVSADQRATDLESGSGVGS